MTEIVMRKHRMGDRYCLIPVDDEGIELLGKLRDGRDVSADVAQKRNPRHHRLFFAILKFVQMHCPLFDGEPIEDIKDALKLATGLVKRHVSITTGETYYVCKSISFASMDQTRFNQFFDAACKVVAERWMPPGTTPDDVRRELFVMVDGPQAIGERAA